MKFVHHSVMAPFISDSWSAVADCQSGTGETVEGDAIRHQDPPAGIEQVVALYAREDRVAGIRRRAGGGVLNLGPDLPGGPERAGVA